MFRCKTVIEEEWHVPSGGTDAPPLLCLPHPEELGGESTFRNSQSLPPGEYSPGGRPHPHRLISVSCISWWVPSIRGLPCQVTLKSEGGAISPSKAELRTLNFTKHVLSARTQIGTRIHRAAGGSSPQPGGGGADRKPPWTNRSL